MVSPLIPSPSEVQSQFAHIHDDKAAQIVVSHAICLPLATIAVVMRLLSRRLCRTSRLQADDFMVIAALVSPLTSLIIVIVILSDSSLGNIYAMVDPRCRTGHSGIVV